MLFGHDCIFLVEQPQNECQLSDILDPLLAAFDMLPPRLPPPQRNYPCLSPSHTRSVFEGGLELLRPSVRGTPSISGHYFSYQDFSDNFFRFFHFFVAIADPKVVSKKNVRQERFLLSHSYFSVP